MNALVTHLSSSSLSLLMSSSTLRYLSELAGSGQTSVSTASSMSSHLLLYFVCAVLRLCGLALDHSTIRSSTLDSMTLHVVPRTPLCALKLLMAVVLSYLRKSDIHILFIC